MVNPLTTQSTPLGPDPCVPKPCSTPAACWLPGNILISNDGQVVVADFGVADSIGAVDPDEDDDDDAPIMIVGTRCYVAPERLRRERGDARSDQFSFCVALWEALHGQRPYAGQSRSDVLESIERGEIRQGPQSEEVPHSLSRVVRKGLCDDPDQRYASMRELLEALRDLPSELEALGDEADAGPLEAWPVNSGLLNTPREHTGLREFLREFDDEQPAESESERPGERVRSESVEASPADDNTPELVHAEPAESESESELESEQPSEPASVSSPASATRREPTWAMVAGALVLGVVLTIAVFAPRESSRVTETSTHTDSATESPCVLTDDDPRPVDPVVLEVCGMIHRDDFRGANNLWLALTNEREQAGRPVGGDSLIVARTFDARAKALRQGEPATTVAADYARAWAGEAAVGLLDVDEKRWLEAARLRDGD